MNTYLQYFNIVNYNNKKRFGINQDGGYVIGLLDEQNNKQVMRINAGTIPPVEEPTLPKITQQPQNKLQH